MIAFNPEILAAFDQGIKKIYCKHSPGKVQTETASPGIHQHREILFVLQGESEFPLNHKLMPVKPGQVVLIDRWDAHCARYVPSDRNLLFLWFFLFPSGLVAWVQHVDGIGNLSHVMKSIDLPFDLAMTVNRRWDELNQLPPDEILGKVDLFMKNLLSTLLDEIRMYLYKKDQYQQGRDGNLKFINSIQRIIEVNNGRDCSLDQLVKITGFSKFYISHTFKKVNGITIGAYIDKIRINFFESARKQGLSHKQIAFELGFSNSSALSTWHRRYCQKKS